jgi:trans-aconitate 2-methyltransferase
MSDAARKDFGAIEGDYDFFIASSNEYRRDLDAYRRHLDKSAAGRGPIRMLDFGCGDGAFTHALLSELAWPSDRLSLALVEPVEAQRHRAAQQLQAFARTPIRHWPFMPDDPVGPFDVVLSNHVLYFVADVDETVERITGALAPDGQWLCAMGGTTNRLIVFWDVFTKLTGRDSPYYRSEDLEAALRRQGVTFAREDVSYQLAFPDSTANRMKILRFLLADHLDRLPHEPFLELFEPWRRGGDIAVEILHYHYTVPGPSA